MLKLRSLLFLCAIGALAFFFLYKQEPKAGTSLSIRVTKLVNQMTASKEEVIAFENIQALGDDAVPFIISHLDDMRSLPDPQISLLNRLPNASERSVHYGAELVHDALAAILRHMTNQDFGAFDADTPRAERMERRKKNRSQWIKWCQRQYSSRAADCGIDGP
ncbi:hypothetical protein [Undibacterium sp. TS12]|uniref:hypothetical protein n=1 Tax=Undibacterium sp. TS12 TaxID=2908202 RepID=UPI001F4C770A|nr:hypothetical protein [Undibacterium sp. TS12]MCH8622561.1 hypothetical protein [Undibacterium sp. TS12]